MLRRFILVLAVASMVPASPFAQGMPDPQPAIDAVGQLAYLAGKWSGNGWVKMGQGPKEEFSQVETIELKLDGAVLLIEGIGHSKGEDARKVHHALATVSFDPEKETLVFSSMMAGRPRLDTVPEIAEQGFNWGFSPSQGGEIRYSIQVDKDAWHEVGEYSPNGETWFQFFEMNLKRQ